METILSEDRVESWLRRHPGVALEARAACEGADAAHDWQHVLRVADNARAIGAAEGARLEVVTAAALLHELFNHPKDHPESALSGDVSADRAAALLRAQPDAWSEEQVECIDYAIRVHSFSRGISPKTIEARVLQDADRLDAIGAIGIARCFATCAVMKRPFYHLEDPFCERRSPDDKLWGVDHFYKKLLRIPDGLHTPAARSMAADRIALMESYLAALRREVLAVGGAIPTSTE